MLYVIPVVFVSLALNLPRWFELKIGEYNFPVGANGEVLYNETLTLDQIDEAGEGNINYTTLVRIEGTELRWVHFGCILSAF